MDALMTRYSMLCKLLAGVVAKYMAQTSYDGNTLRKKNK